MTLASITSRPSHAPPQPSVERGPIALVMPDGGPQIRRVLGQPSQANHIVQFYDSDTFLCDNVAHFIAAGIAAGEPTIVIGTAAHLAGFRERLEHNAIDLSRARAAGLFTELDADEMLARVMVGSLPDAARVRDIVGGVVTMAQAMRPDSRVRAYGEMVDLLWRAGNRAGAIRLEELWNDLGAEQSFSLLCAYTMSNFETAGDRSDFDGICKLHTHVMPADGYPEIPHADGRLREVTLLQQRAVSLEHEVARRRELEQELRDALLRETGARAEAERTVHYNELFAGMLGHDLRNPLNAILTTAHYIARSSEETKTTAAAMRIATSSQRMARMIEQLLDFTKIRVGQGLALNRIPVDFLDLCEGVKTELDSAHPEATITLVSRGSTAAEFDFDRVLQVLSNIFGNAVHHGTPGGVVAVDVDGTSPGAIVVRVHNAGIVPAEVVPLLFEPFRAGNKSQHTRGLGLGLYISRQIVVAHGGKIGVTSTEADGTTLQIELPRHA